MTEQTRYCRYLNLLTDFVREKRKIPGVTIFNDCSELQVTGHPTGTRATPAFVAVRKGVGESLPFPLYWPALEAIGEVDSGEDGLDAEAQCVLSTGRLLQARPDYISVQGISIRPGGFKLIIARAWGVSCTGPSTGTNKLLAASFVHDLISIQTLQRRHLYHYQYCGYGSDLQHPVFWSYLSRLLHSLVGGAFSRRAIIFDTAEPNVVIKEQYVDTARQDEGSILGTIHRGGTFPGVIRVGWHGTIQSDIGQIICVEDDDGVKEKRRPVMLDQAGPLMDTTTLRDALIAIYDLLEVTRFLYTKRRILHRDISVSNVLLRDAATIMDYSFTGDLQDMCSAAYLLKQKSHASK